MWPRVEIVERLAEARLRSYHPVILAWQQRRDISERLESDTAALLRPPTDGHHARTLRARFPARGVTDPALYLDSLIRLSDGSLALTGIRFRGGDPGRPFVDVIALEGNLTEARLGPLDEAIEIRWGCFSPLCLRVVVPATGELDRFGVHFRVDCRIVAGRVADIRSRPGYAVAGLSVRAAEDMSWYGEYRREYARFLGADESHRELTWPESYDALARTAAAAGVFLVRLHGRLAGVYAIPRGSAHGLIGFRMQEKVLFEFVRGMRLGLAAERAVIDRLPANAQDVIFGSIAEGNTPSRRTAYQVGRVDIAARLWLTRPRRSA